MKATIEDLIKDLRAEAPMIPIQLHAGLRSLCYGFGGEINYLDGNCLTAAWLERYSKERRPEEGR